MLVTIHGRVFAIEAIFRKIYIPDLFLFIVKNHVLSIGLSLSIKIIEHEL